MAHLLIVDDDEDFALAAAKILRDAGHDVEIEPDPQTAAARIEKDPPDLVILDVMFPDDYSAGFNLARLIARHREKSGRIRVLMLSGVNAMFRLGFGRADIDDDWLPVDNFLEKPIDLDILLTRVTTLLEQESGERQSE